MRATRRLSLLVVVAFGLSLLETPPASAAGSLTVTPGTGLLDLQSVAVEGSGFNASVGIGVCQTLVVDLPPAPDLCGNTLVLVTSSSAGTFVVPSYAVRRFMYVSRLGRTVDCLDPAEQCVIGAAEAADIAGTITLTPIAFAPPPPPPSTPGLLSYAPTTDLVNGDVVTVKGRGFRPASTVEVLQCAAEAENPTQCNSASGVATTDATGRFTAQLTVSSRVSTVTTQADCAFAGNCEVAAAEVVDLTGTIVGAPLTVAGLPGISVAPSSGLFSGQTITVSGSGFPPNEPRFLQQCGDICGEPTAFAVGADGKFVLPLVVTRDLLLGSCTPLCSAVVVSDTPGLDFQNDYLSLIAFAPPVHQPDGQLELPGRNGGYIGDDVYNLDATGQRGVKTIAAGQHLFWPLKVQNDGDGVDDIVVTGPAGTPAVTIRYFVGYYDVTSYVVEGGFTFHDIAPGAAASLVVSFAAAPNAPGGSTAQALVTFTSAQDPAGQDAVGPGVAVAGHGP
jgi:hypothetical protein